MKLQAEQIQENWDTHLKIVEKYISSPRKEQVLDMLTSLEDKIVLSPASGKAHYHNAFPGGYVDHVNRVVVAALKTRKLWQELGVEDDFTTEELVFSALFHDFGKVGDGTEEGYLPQEDKWRQDKLGEKYTPNPKLPFMLIPDRSLYILQSYGISCTLTEYITIRIHDGLYDDSNKAYFISHNPESKLRTNLPYIIHQADMVAARMEYLRTK